MPQSLLIPSRVFIRHYHNPCKIPLPAPVAGEAPTRIIAATERYSGDVFWVPEVEDVFEGNTVYTAIIILHACNGYTFNRVKENCFTVPGAEATNPANSSTITAVFPKTGDPLPPGPQKASIKLISGIAPEPGEQPAISYVTDEYTGSITWEPEHNEFLYGISYKANIKLEAKDGYTFTGVAQNWFEADGATSCTNPAILEKLLLFSRNLG